MNPANLIPRKVIEAKPDGLGGPRWVANLEDGTTIVGRPSWMGNSGAVALPNDSPQPESDWGRLKVRCAETNTRIKSLSLWVPTYGWFHAPANMGAYGFFEVHVRSMHLGKLNGHVHYRSGCEAICICWPDKDKGRPVIKVKKIFANGTYEEWNRSQWLPCLIGPPEAEQTFKDEGTLALRAIQ